jgi:uncharacterized membrane protein
VSDSGRRPARTPWIVAAAFSLSGAVHLIHPSTFTAIVPDLLPAHTAVVYASGVAELVCAVGLWRRDRWAGIASALLLLAIWPANLKMALDAEGGYAVAAWLRLPVQIPLVWWAWQSGRTPRRSPR